MAWMLPGDDDQPATRRDLSSAREAIAHQVRADIAEVRTEMVEGFRATDQKIADVRMEIAGVRTEMAKGFRATDQKIADVRMEIADVRKEMTALSTKQTRFLVGLMVVMNGTVLAAVLRTG